MLVQNEFEKLKTFDSSLFVGQSALIRMKHNFI